MRQTEDVLLFYAEQMELPVRKNLDFLLPPSLSLWKLC